MIYTVTLNPAVDLVVHCKDVKNGAVNRADKEEIYFGGKGINVSLVLAQLEVRSRALGFVAGFTGEAIEKGIHEAGVETDFVHLSNGFSRINVKLKSGEETEINGQGPQICDDDIAQLYQKIDMISDGDTLVLAGSVPASLPHDIYEKIAQRLSAKKVRIVADASGKLLINILKYRPFLIKPNHHELAEIFGVELDSDEKIIEYARRLQQLGAENVLVSMAGDGALLIDSNGNVHRCAACRGEVKNSVGAGDSMVAGFIAGCDSGDLGYALRLGTACGGATAFSDGLAEKKLIQNLLNSM